MKNFHITFPLPQKLKIDLVKQNYNFAFFSLLPYKSPKDVFNAIHLLLVLENKKSLECFKKMSITERDILYKKLSKIFWYLHVTTKTYCFSFSITKNTDPIFVDTAFLNKLEKFKIPLKDLHDYKSIKYLIDGIEKTIHNSSRSFYSQHCYKKTFQIEKSKVELEENSKQLELKKNSSNNNKTKKLTRKEKIAKGISSPKELLLAKMPDFLSTQTNYYKTLLANYHIKSDLNRDCSKILNNHFNFIFILESYLKTPSSIIQQYFSDLDAFINKQKIWEEESKLGDQFQQYIEQIMFYICLCNHLLTRLEAKGIMIDVNTFFQLRNIFIFNYETKGEVSITQGEELPYVYIASSKVNLDVKQVNPKIAFLNQMEFFYFNKLEFLYILAEYYLKETKKQS